LFSAIIVKPKQEDPWQFPARDLFFAQSALAAGHWLDVVFDWKRLRAAEFVQGKRQLSRMLARCWRQPSAPAPSLIQ
jgi:hypothetical protein